ncbi:hypothetical protein CROQUDRAFT_87881 [Cronartium quercuum f. sp. fusiforme G11]|uniref:Uncharacterized protein n=1 Tax=Cronartium quercuum f. sp. fusiforme G11 TaxID=708437 RepID=A0A9P6NU36_9BASI|nr:hypothetical protein CROQUDRAFT_87881 [Cronartium quercuum f. sp. fusiforme G11]
MTADNHMMAHRYPSEDLQSMAHVILKRESRRIGSRQLATHRSKGDFHEHRSMLTHTRLGRVLNAEDWSVNDLIIVGWDWAQKRSEDGGISTDLSQIRWGWRSKANPITAVFS